MVARPRLLPGMTKNMQRKAGVKKTAVFHEPRKLRLVTLADPRRKPLISKRNPQRQASRRSKPRSIPIGHKMTIIVIVIIIPIGTGGILLPADG